MKRTKLWKIIGRVDDGLADEDNGEGVKRELWIMADEMPDPATAHAALLDGEPANRSAEVHAIQFNRDDVRVPDAPPEDATREMPAVPAHKPMSKGELLDVLQDMYDHIRADDSLEGSIEYLVPLSPENADDDFMVMASYRIGNREGQGGVRLFRATDPS